MVAQRVSSKAAASGKDAGVAGRGARARVVDRNLAVEADGRARNQRLAVLHAGAVDGVTGGKVVGAVQDDIGLRNQVVEQAIIGAVKHRRDAHIGVDLGDGVTRRVGLGFSHARHRVRDLALQVGGIDMVVVDDRQVAHASAAQVQGHR
jgi:hypothetical protein